MLDSKSDSQQQQGGMDNGYNNYNANASSPQPQQNQYNNPSSTQNNYGQNNNYGGMKSTQNNIPQYKIPEIDIDEDEIPF